MTAHLLFMIKSPLRYPGGKSKAIGQIINYLPERQGCAEGVRFSEYREPFVGGGSVFIYLKQQYPDLKIWINDLNTELYLFWKFAQADLSKLVEEIRRIKRNYTEGKVLFQELTMIEVRDLSDFDRAVRFFVLNRITFSGTVEAGGFSQEAFQKRFTDSSIDRLEKLASIVKDIKITNVDYSELLTTEGKAVFIFLDPPYFIATKSRLYGKNGDLHSSFDHALFAERMRDCHHQWLITYDNSPQIRENFNFTNIYDWELQYGMNNYKQEKSAKGKELFIVNYPIK
jgi:DNA adenine methylase